ncbi:type I phosphomannose isomerase catalytic subunit [Lutibacter sp.]|uniref:type I phosphomannose isomerase catalytic subunit n=1 Tax=Lutibacter sp. TaxID=1925666 RepID=UPI003567666C
MMNINYPIKFEPILKDKIWGGEKLKLLFNKKSIGNDIGESWEVSDVDGNISVVSNGDLKGQSLQEILRLYKDELVGKNVYKNFGDKFPLLIKLIDAKEALSIQVHPNDVLAKERHNSFGKTEMWYIMQAEDSGNLIVGFNKDSSKEEYIEHLESKRLLKILNLEKVKKGDVYFIPTGRIHAIGAGVLLAEIQQTSDITYRVYDWDRLDDAGNSRELHTELAADTIDYSSEKQYSTDYNTAENVSTPVVSCDYFTTNIVVVNGEVQIDNSAKDSFVIYMCVEGEVIIKYGNSKEEKLVKGETVLMPASLKKYQFKSSENSELLEVFIKN